MKLRSTDYCYQSVGLIFKYFKLSVFEVKKNTYILTSIIFFILENNGKGENLADQDEKYGIDLV